MSCSGFASRYTLAGVLNQQRIQPDKDGGDVGAGYGIAGEDVARQTCRLSQSLSQHSAALLLLLLPNSCASKNIIVWL